MTPKTRRRLRRLAATSLAIIIALFVGWWSARWYIGSPLEQLEDRWHVGTRILDRDGELLFFAPSEAGLRGTPTPLENVGNRVILATLVAEDQRFYDHDGIDRRALVRAMMQAAGSGHIVSGASTITQQLVEILDSGGRPGPTRLPKKLGEIARAQNLEASLDKDAILEAYLDRLPYGNNIVGIGAAAQTYFGRSPSQLSWAQAAYLAVIPRAPSALNPYEHSDAVLQRQRYLLHALGKRGHLDDRELEAALSEPIVLETRHDLRAPHFSLWVSEASDAAVIDTTLDGRIQHQLDAALRRHLPRLRRSGAHQAAGIVVSNKTGEILAYSGSADWDDPNDGRIDMVQSRRPAGSILKPFGYALAYENGLRPTDLLADVPTSFEDSSGIYTPNNIDRTFLGPLAAAEALALSRNIPAVEVGQFVGTERLLELLRRVGFVGLSEAPEFYGPALILGSAEVSLLEVAAAYACLARSGECIALTWQSGKSGQRVRVFSPAAAELVSENLSNPAWRVRFLMTGMVPTQFDAPVATKTGTSQHHVDTWAIAFTRDYTVAIWAGNADGTQTRGLTGGTGAGPITIDVIRFLVSEHEGEAMLWDTPALESANVCPGSGLLVTDACPEAVERLVAPSQMLTSCTLHRRGEASPKGNEFTCTQNGSDRAVILDSRYQSWLEERRAIGHSVDAYGYPIHILKDTKRCD